MRSAVISEDRLEVIFFLGVEMRVKELEELSEIKFQEVEEFLEVAGIMANGVIAGRAGIEDPLI